MKAEDELVGEERRHRRQRTRRLLVEERDHEMHAEIRRLKLTPASWVMLTAAASATLNDALVS